ncbi:MAG: hypothetical protein HYU64_12470 [Armatimonadetes bacterium]|nr:hypothetical protein [Armatimonadota bacterium]
MKRPSKILKTFLKQHRDEQTLLLFWSCDLKECSSGRIIDFDEEYVLLRQCDEETEEPYELLVKLDNITTVCPWVEKLNVDRKFRKITHNFEQSWEDDSCGQDV